MVSGRSVEASRESVLHYLPQVDGVRGIAILLVLWYHGPFLFRELPQFSGQDSPWSFLGLFGRMSLGGWIGVDLFFVVSGFLITMILLRVKEMTGSNLVFWERRALRIFPLAIVYLVSLLILVRLGDPLVVLASFDAWAWYALYLSNLHITFYGWQPLAIMILWSLAIEEQFYLVWPFVVRMCDSHELLRWSIGCVVIAPLVRALTVWMADYPATYVFTLCRLDALAAGAVVAACYSSKEWRDLVMASCKRLAPPALAVIFLVLLVPFSPSIPQTRPWLFSVFGYTAIATSWAILLMASLDARGPIEGFLTSRILTFLGRRCYGLYIWHVLAGGIAIMALHPWHVGFLAHAAVWLAILLMMASASWLLLEAPMLRLKRFLSYGGTPSRTADSFPILRPLKIR
jgi:peptidoglycan/LPS O-acetylase OafA/YrhL